jgi:hypothetical protein
VLFLSLHHIVFDGWSIGVLNQELLEHYRAGLAGEAPTLPALPVQYRDFVAWQRQWLTGEVLERQLAYWRGRLGGELPVLELPTDRPRPAVQTYRGAGCALELPRELTRALAMLSRRRGVTLAMTLLAAFKALLCRYTGQDDILVGTPIANRTQREIEGLIGFFVNSLVLRTDLSGDPSFSELLARVHATMLEAHEHQDLPFERLVDELQPERDPARNPIFQVVFAMQNASRDPLALPGLSIEPLATAVRATRFDLELHLAETPDGVRAGFCYNRDLFDASTIERLGRHYCACSRPPRPRPTRPSRACRCCSTTSASRCSSAGTTPRCPSPSPSACTSASRPRSSARRRPSRSASRARPSPTPSSTPAPTRSRTCCASTAWGPRRASACASSAGRGWSSGCWPCSRRAPATCRSTWPTRPSASPSSCRTRACRCCSPRAASWTSSRRTRRGSCASTASARASTRRARPGRTRARRRATWPT